MGTTANYSWPTPVATDLVKDGWEAIKDLGDAADTTVKAVSDAQGLVHIETATFSAVSAVNIDDVFSSTYNNYRLLVSLAASTGSPAQTLRMRVSSSDASGANYNFQELEAFQTTAAAARSLSQTSGRYMYASTGAKGIACIDIFAPYLSEVTMYNSISNYDNGSGSYYYSGAHTLATSYTGISLITGVGNITGSYSVYGYRKA